MVKELHEGENELKDSDGNNHRIKLQIMNVWQNLANRKCIKLTSTMQERPSSSDQFIFFDSSFYLIQFSAPAPKQALLYVTSEENSYGATLAKWCDGKVDPYILENMTEHFLNFEVQEYQYLQDQCQSQS